MKALFVTWDGPEQDYLSSLFLPQFERASELGVSVAVLQFGWSRAHARRTREAAERRGLEYEFIEVLRNPRIAATGLAILQGAIAVRRECQRQAVDVVLPRSIIPAAMVLASRTTTPMVFDADGLVADERVDFAGWRASSPMYRIWRDCEAQAVRASISVITRTERARRILLHRAGPGVSPTKIHVVPNGKDARQFRPRDDQHRARIRARYGVAERAPWCVIVGSHGPQYLPEQSLRLFAEVLRRRSDARLHVLTGQADAYRASAQRAGLDPGTIWFGRVAPDEVPEVLAAADCGFALRQASFSQQAVCPIKVGEYLLCGLPVVATRGVGDLDDQLDDPAACLLDGTGAAELTRGAEWVSRVIGNRSLAASARALGLRHFALDSCAQAFCEALGVAPRAAERAGAERLASIGGTRAPS